MYDFFILSRQSDEVRRRLLDEVPMEGDGQVDVAPDVARREGFALTLALAALIVYASLFPFTGWRDPANRDYLLKLLTAFGITAVLGLVVKKLGFELPETVTPIAWALVIGGIWMIWAESVAEKQPDRVAITWRVAIAVGIAQIIAGMFPGTSRSAATIFAAMLLGTSNRAAATEFAFLVGIPTMYAASGYALLKEFKDGAGTEDWTGMGIAFVVSMVTAFVAVKWLLGYIRTHRFTAFAVYRIVFGAILLGLGWAGIVQ